MGRYKNSGADREWGKRIPEDLKSIGGALLPPGGDRVISLRGRAGYKYGGRRSGAGDCICPMAQGHREDGGAVLPPPVGTGLPIPRTRGLQVTLAAFSGAGDCAGQAGQGLYEDCAVGCSLPVGPFGLCPPPFWLPLVKGEMLSVFSRPVFGLAGGT